METEISVGNLQRTMNDMIILDLVQKAKWYDMIERGAKLEEYREIKPYWDRRLFSRPYTHVRFRRGYTSKSMTYTIPGEIRKATSPTSSMSTRCLTGG